MARRRPAAPPPQPESPSARALRERAQDALRRQLAGEKLSAADANAIAKWERSTDARRRAEALASVSGEDLRAVLGGISRQQVVRLAAYGMPRNPDGSYSLLVTVPWYLAHERDRLAAEKSQGETQLERFRSARAELAVLDTARKKGQLLPADLAAAEMERVSRVVAEELLSWASSLPPRLAGLEHRAVAAVLGTESRRVLDRLSAAVERERAGRALRKGERP